MVWFKKRKPQLLFLKNEYYNFFFINSFLTNLNIYVKTPWVGTAISRHAVAVSNLRSTSSRNRPSWQLTRNLHSTIMETSLAWSWSTTDIAVSVTLPPLKIKPHDREKHGDLICCKSFSRVQFTARLPHGRNASHNRRRFGWHAFVQFHLHWGSESSKGSEHLIKSKG